MRHAIGNYEEKREREKGKYDLRGETQNERNVKQFFKHNYLL